MSLRTAYTHDDERIDVVGFHAPGGGDVTIAAGQHTYNLDTDNARRLVIALHTAIADALGEDRPAPRPEDADREHARAVLDTAAATLQRIKGGGSR